MKIRSKEITVRTRGYCDIIDLTPQMEAFLSEEGIETGQFLVFVPGSTAGITTIEFEPGLKRDLKEFFEKLIPSSEKYFHNDTWHDGNGFAHVRAAFLKPSLTIPVIGNKLGLGTWQQVVLIDFDNRDRNRRVILQLSGL